MKIISFVTPRHRTGLYDLPLELLSEVASYLDFADILSLQQTSKKLRESTEAHVVWLTLAKKYSARHFHHYRPDTGSIDAISTDELRAWIQKRLVVDQIWRAHRVRPHFRVLPENWGIVFKLIPGGRWLLMGCKDSSVCYYDLDSGDLKRAPLIPPSSAVEGNSDRVDELEIHVDQDASRLEFKLLVLSTGFPPDERDGLNLWQVTLQDGNSLAAEWLRSFSRGYALVDSLSLGKHLIVCAMASSSSPSWIEVIWWERGSITRDLRARFSVGDPEVDKTYLIGDDKILCINEEGVVRLYNLPEPDRTNGGVDISLIRPEHLPSHEPIWSYTLLGGRCKHSSLVYYSGTAYRLVVSTDDGIWGLVLPATNNDDPLVVKLSNVSQQWVTCIPGVCKAYAFHHGGDGTGVRIGHNWDDGVGIPTVRYVRGIPKVVASPGRHLAFDEETGRVVYPASCKITVVDYFP